MSEARPLLRVVKGEPTPEEVAALVAVLTARVATDNTARPPVSGYAAPTAGHRRPLAVGPGAWVASGWLAGTRTKAQW